ncbi:hypothetical protein N7537_010554 [Penicillium hordei]|uniref:NACHT domain-containing protein n=1 Tax=Penicillium hordei TaxID=40994 RepID=A0AAD6DVK0_9EURO|nr:uncharacterized protein N7537_010554 [Penicillium hordei]KAJ5593650.1 hypothetical protein N7537_010554 [Penicillium hordei]
MASAAYFNGPNSGAQIGYNSGHITNNIYLPQGQGQSETSADQDCLRDLQTTNPRDDKTRIEKTKGGLLNESYRWVLQNNDFQKWRLDEEVRLLWIQGDPGKGKTMLLCGIIDELRNTIDNASMNISFFFCQATDERINNAIAVLRGLIFMLACEQPSVIHHIRRRYDQTGKQLFEDANAWQALSGILSDILEDPTLKDTYFIIDALDECTADLSLLLDLIAEAASSGNARVKWIVSSRNWPIIEEYFEVATQKARLSLELNATSISEAVAIYIQFKVQQLAEKKKYKPAVRDIVANHLMLNSQDTFLWVALVYEELAKARPWNTPKLLTSFPPGLDSLYGRMLQQIRDSEDAELCNRILGVASTVYRPITLNELVGLVDMPDGVSIDDDDVPPDDFLSDIIRLCGSFLTLRENTVFFVHQSAKDFLTTKALDEVFPRGVPAEHHEIFSRSIHVMSRSLRHNIYDIAFPGLQIDDVTQPIPDPLAAARYSCQYWAHHLQGGYCSESAVIEPHHLQSVDTFLQQRYLHWIEALCLIRNVPRGIEAMLKLEGLFKESQKSSPFFQRVHDASRFIRYHKVGIESGPLQVYSSSLIFSPTQSMTKLCYQKERVDWIVHGPSIEDDWSACIQTLEGHDLDVPCIAWSQDGRRLASASKDKTARIWDSTTGQCISVLRGHEDELHSIDSIAWIQHDERLASASNDKTIRIWNPVTGQCISTLRGHGNQIRTIAWSPDFMQLASGSFDKTVRVWDPNTGQCLAILEGHKNNVSSVAWLPPSRRLASVSEANIRIWDTVSCQCIFDLEDHSSTVWSISWSRDASRLASTSNDETVRVWDPSNGACLSILSGHSGPVRPTDWSPDGRRLASADKTIKIWDIATGDCVSGVEKHGDVVESISWSPDGNRLATRSGSVDDNTVRIWDAATGDCLSFFELHRSGGSSLAWSLDGRHIALAGRAIRIWDPSIKQPRSTFQKFDGLMEGTSGGTFSWSPNGAWLASSEYFDGVRIWDPIASCASMLLDSRYVTSIGWSHDSQQLASGSYSGEVCVWDPVTRERISTLEGHERPVFHLRWSQDGRLASGSDDQTIKIWNPETRQCTADLGESDGEVLSISWSLDGRWLAAMTHRRRDEDFKIWDLAITVRDSATGQYISSIDVQLPVVQSFDEMSAGEDLPTFLEFDKNTPNRLHTLAGTFDLINDMLISTSPLNLPPAVEQQIGYGLSYDTAWITYRGKRLMWLPSEYRPAVPSLFATYETGAGVRVGILCRSGRVITLTLSQYIANQSCNSSRAIK